MGAACYRWDPDNVIWDAIAMSRLVRANGYSTAFAARITNYADGEQTVMYTLPAESKHVYRLRDGRDWLEGMSSVLCSQRIGMLRLLSLLACAEHYGERSTRSGCNGPTSRSRSSRVASRPCSRRSVGRPPTSSSLAYRPSPVSLASPASTRLSPNRCMTRVRNGFTGHVRLFSSGPAHGETEGPGTQQERERLAAVALLKDLR